MVETRLIFSNMTEIRGTALRVVDGVLYIRDDDQDEIEFHLLPGLATWIPNVQKLIGHRVSVFYDAQGVSIAPIREDEPLVHFHSHQAGNQMISCTALRYLKERGSRVEGVIKVPVDGASTSR